MKEPMGGGCHERLLECAVLTIPATSKLRYLGGMAKTLGHLTDDQQKRVLEWKQKNRGGIGELLTDAELRG